MEGSNVQPVFWLLSSSAILTALIVAMLAWHATRMLGKTSRLTIRLLFPIVALCLYPSAWIPSGYLAGVSFALLPLENQPIQQGFFVFALSSTLIAVLVAWLLLLAAVALVGRLSKRT